MMKRVFLVLYILILISCKTSEKAEYLNPDKVFNLKDTLKGIVLEATLSQDSASYTSLLYTPIGIICKTGLNNELFYLLDSVKGDKVTSCGCKGRGRGELLSCISYDYNSKTNNLYVWDIYLNSIHSFSLTDSCKFEKRERLIRVNTHLNKIKSVNDSLFAVLTFHPDQSIGLIDKTGNFISKLPYKTIENKEIDYDLNYFSSTIAISPDKRYIAVSDLNFPSIKLYSISDNKLKILWEKMIFEPSYTIVNKWYRINDDQQFGFGDIHMSTENIYVLSHGVKYKEFRNGVFTNNNRIYILQFDYEGNYIKCFVLNDFMYLFEISPDGKSLYGKIDEALIKKYSLSGNPD